VDDETTPLTKVVSFE